MAGVKPTHVFLDISLACNLRCIQCGIHRLSDPPESLDLAQRRRVVRQIAEWDPSIRLVLTGGELLLHRNALWDIAQCCKEHGVYATLSTNGTLVTKRDAEILAASGIRCVVVSLDSHVPATHDRIRGISGTWDRAVQGVRWLVAARDKSANGFSVLTSSILGEHNLHETEELLIWLWSLGIDTTLFQPVQPDFARPHTPGWHKSSPLWPRQTSTMNAGIDNLIRHRRAGMRIFQTPEKFEDMRAYFDAPDGLKESVCASLDGNMMIDITGQVRFCFLMDSLGLPVAGNVRKESLQAIWENRTACEAAMRGCRRGCGAMICHAR